MPTLRIDTEFNTSGVTNHIKDVTKAANDVVSSVKEAMSSVHKQMDATQKSLADSIQKEIKSIAKELSSTESQITSLQNKLNTLNQPTNKETAYADAIKKSTQNIQKMTDAIEKSKTAYLKQQTNLDLVVDKIHQLEVANQKLRKEIGMASDGADKVSMYDTIAKNEKEIEKLNGVMKEEIALLDQAEKQMEKTDAAMQKGIQNEKDNIDSLNEKLEEEKKKREAIVESTEKLLEAENNKKSNLSSQMASKVAEYNQLAEAVEETVEAKEKENKATEENTKKQKENNAETQKGITATEGYKQVIEALPAPIRSAVEGITGMTKAALKFIATPLGVVIASLVVALKSVQLYFTRTTDGANKFAYVLGYLKGIVASVENAMIKFGKKLVDTFSRPQEILNKMKSAVKGIFDDPIKSLDILWGKVKEVFVDRFQGLVKNLTGFGNILKGVFTLDWDTLKKGLEEWAEGAAQLTLGSDMTNNLKAAGQEALATAEKIGKLSEQMKKLERQQSAFAVTQASLDRKIAEEQEAMVGGNYSEQYEHAAKALELMKQKYDGLVGLKSKELSLTRQMKAAGDTSISQASINDLSAELIELQSQRTDALRGIEKRMETIRLNIEKKGLKLTETQQQYAREAARAATDAVFAQTEATIEAMHEGEEKERQQRQLAHDRFLEDIRRQKEDAEKAARDKVKAEFEANAENSNKVWNDDVLYDAEAYSKADESVKQLVDEYRRMVADSIVKIENTIIDNERAQMTEYVKIYGNALEKRLQLTKEYDEKIAHATSETQAKMLQEEKRSVMRQNERQRQMAVLDIASNGGRVVQEQLGPLIKSIKDSVEAALASKDFSRRSKSEQKEVLDMSEWLASMNVFTGEVTSVREAAEKLKKAMENREKADKQAEKVQKDLLKQQKLLTEAEKKLENSTSEYNDKLAEYGSAIATGDETLASQISEQVDQSRKQMENDKEVVDSMQKQTETLKSNVVKFTDAANTAANEEANALNNLKVSTISADEAFGKTMNMFSKVSSAANVFQTIGEKVGGFWGAIIQIIGEIKGDAAGWIEDLLNDIGGIFETLLSQLTDGSLFEGIFEGVGSVFNSIGAGLGITGNNESETEKRLKSLDSRADVLSTSIERLTKEVDEVNGFLGKQRKLDELEQEYSKKEQTLVQSLYERNQEYGSHHSNQYYMRRAWEGEWSSGARGAVEDVLKAFAEEFGTVAKKFETIDDLYKISSEEWAYMRQNYNSLYQYFTADDSAWNGMYSNEYYDQLADLGDEKLKELYNLRKDVVAGFDFNSMYSDFISTLEDMDASAEDFGEDFVNKLEKQFLNNKIGDMFSAELEDVWNRYYAAMEEERKNGGDGVLDQEVVDNFRREIEGIGKRALEEKERLLGSVGNDIVNDYIISFEEMRSSFMSMIGDMNLTAEDFKESFSTMMYNALMEQKMQTEYDDILKEWRKKANGYVADGTLEQHLEELQSEYTDLLKRISEDSEAINKITGRGQKEEPLIDFETIKSDFASMVMDMDATATDFTDSLKQKMYEALVQKQIQAELGEEMQEWYNDFSKMMSDKNNMDEETYNSIMERYGALSEQSKEIARAIAEILGIAVDKIEELNYITFDQLKSNFSNILNGMQVDSATFAENFSRQLINSIINAHIEGAWKATLEGLQDRMNKFVEEGADFGSEAFTKLSKDYIDAFTEMAEQSEKWASAAGLPLKAIESTATEVTTTIQEEEKQFTFDDIRNRFMSLMSDLSKSSEEFSKDFKDLMFEAVISQQFEKQMEGKLQSWYDDFDRWFESGGDVQTDAYKDLMRRYEALGEEAATLAQKTADAIGIATENMLDNLTNTSYDSLRGEWVSLLNDMDSEAADFSDNFTEMLQSALINAQMKDILDENLKVWYKNFGEAMDDGLVSDEELAFLKNEYDDLVDEALKRRTAILDIIGVNKAVTQKGGSTAFQGMNQQTGDELNGRFTALQISGENIDATTRYIASMIESYIGNSSSVSGREDYVRDIRDMMVLTNTHLEDMVRYAKMMYSDHGAKLDGISNKLNKL